LILQKQNKNIVIVEKACGQVDLN